MDVAALIQQLYPQARITSGYRSPDSKLGRANPRSYHNIGRAFDVAPIPGVKFDDYVNSLKAKGVNVVEALDEQSHPKAWTTGPNWHVAFGPEKKPQDYAGKYYPENRNKAMASPLAKTLGQVPQFNIGNAAAQVPGFDIPALLKQSLPDGSNIAEAFARNQEVGDEKAKKGAIWRGVLGAISDGLLALGNQQPMYAPMAARAAEIESERNFAREELAAKIQAQREAAMNPKPTQTDRYVAEILDPNTPTERRNLLRSILVRPLAIPMFGADGSQSIQYVSPDQMGGGDDEWSYSN